MFSSSKAPPYSLPPPPPPGPSDWKIKLMRHTVHSKAAVKMFLFVIASYIYCFVQLIGPEANGTEPN